MNIYGLENRVVNWPEESSWYNFGYWQNPADTYPQACQRLAHLLAKESGLAKKSRVLDVGCGCGDQDLYWLKEFAPAKIDAINNSKKQLLKARELRQKEKTGQISFFHSSFQKFKSANQYSFILALDSAYHVDKELFLSKSKQLADNKATLAFTDIILPDKENQSFKSRFWARLFCLLSTIPYRNLKTVSGLQNLAETHGWMLKKQDDITVAVWHGYSAHIKNRRKRLFKKFGLKSLRFIAAAVFVGYLARHGILSYQLFVFRRGV